MAALAPHRFDNWDVEKLTAMGSMKWTRFPQTLAGFVAEMDFPLDPAVRDALLEAIDNQRFGYLPEPVKHDMQQATREFLHSRYQWAPVAERIYPVGDVLAAYEVALRRLVSPGSPVIVPTPAYMPFLTLTEALGHPVIQVPMLHDDSGRPQLDLEAIDRELQGAAELVVLCNPHNPLGIVHEKAELLALADVVERRGGVVFADEIHAPLVWSGHTHVPYASVSEAANEHSVTATSASKAWNLPGLKCAQLIVTSDRFQQVIKPIEFTISHTAATPGILATTAAYRHGAPWLGEVTDYLEGSLGLVDQWVTEGLPHSSYRRPEGTYILWLDASRVDIGDADSPAEYFREKAGVSLTDGAMCGEAGVGHLRVIIATPRPILEQMFQRLAEHWTVSSPGLHRSDAGA